MHASEVIPAEAHAYAFDASLPPVRTVEPGSIVTFEVESAVLDRFAAGESLEQIGWENLNAVTGPVAVRGAEPGDALRVTVLDIQVRFAAAAWVPGLGGLGRRTATIQVRPTPVEGDRVRIGDRLTVPLAPMIGCIGVAPAAGRGSTLRPVYPYGGNMDLRELSVGAVLWLPVQVPGALLSVGDLHAAMGQGEPTSISLEAAGAATLRIDLEQGAAPPTPRLRVGRDTICVGIGETHRQAAQTALDQAFDVLVGEHGLEPFTAYAYASARVGLRLGGPAAAIVLAVVPDPDDPGSAAAPDVAP